MSDDDNEELPMIFVSSSVSDASRFSMPSAELVATQRARERECEQQLRRLRERHAHDDALDAALARADSSGSEGEAALAAAVTDLRVAAPPAPPSPAAPSAARLLAALAPRLAAPARRLLEHPDTARRLPELVTSVGAMVSSDECALSDEDAAAAGALLTAAVLAPDTRERGGARRALHALLDHCASREQALELARAALGALPDARARLELSDALRSGAGGGADALAAHVRDAALAALLGAAGADAERLAAAAARWRGLAPGPRYTALQLLGRRLAAPPAGSQGDEREARARLLAALAPAAREHDAQRPDQLKVLVGAARLRLLFRADT